MFGVFAQYPQVFAATGDGEIADDDYAKYLKYDKYLKYTKRKKYRKYKKAKKKYGFDSSAKKFKAKACYREIKDLRKRGRSKKSLKSHSCYKGYKKYKKYKKYYSPTRKYKKYKKYNLDKYDHPGWKRYKTSANKTAYYRWKKTHRREADLGGGTYGPNISVGLHAMTEDQLEDDSFRIRAYEASSGDAIPYKIQDKNGNAIVNVAAGERTKVKYSGNRTYRIYDYDDSISGEEKTASQKINFVAKNSADVNDIYFLVEHDSFSSSYDKYRDKIQLTHYDPSGGRNDRIWIVNILPLEHYVWGMGEITGTGHMEYNRVMTTSYRTYGYWKIKYSTRYAPQGFKVNATPGNQIYRGFVWEETYPRIKVAATGSGDGHDEGTGKSTRGKIVMYGHRVAITPYSSWTDGRTRSFEDRWGSENYPWCRSVKDPYGKHPSMSTSALVAAGNHMVGLSAHGALDRADAGWSYSRILNYYYEDIDIYQAY